jgi:hypothetical protein
MDDTLQWLIGGGTAIIGLVAAACIAILPLIILAIFGIFLFRRSQQSNAARQAAQSWASTSGTVFTSTIQVRRTGRSRSEIPVVMYQYEVNGQPYQGNVIRAGSQFGQIRVMGDAQRTIARYPVGSQVVVYYNPAEAALER